LDNTRDNGLGFGFWNHITLSSDLARLDYVPIIQRGWIVRWRKIMVFMHGSRESTPVL
jgi:hypothetical protein